MNLYTLFAFIALVGLFQVVKADAEYSPVDNNKDELPNVKELDSSFDDVHGIDAKYDAAPAAAPKTWTSRRRSFSFRRRTISVYRRRRSIDFSRRRSIYLSRRRRRRSSALQILGNKMILGIACITAIYCLRQ
eukprot:Seg6786.1 transcript_id=Seg6786.1/GoldUCD/mRNA.D3Y31 product="hypothetical protein" protein_id=Seg6786.1/GoldUCD/D3Y31